IPPRSCLAASTASTARPESLPRQQATTANTASFWIDGRDEDKPMKKLNHVARALAFVGIAAVMAGCKTPSMQEQVTGSIPNDYRLRHPIAVREKAKTLTVFIGDGRGTLTPTQRAEVGALASSWRQEATGGIIIEMPIGAANERAAATASREIRAILTAAGVAAHSIEIRPYRTQDPVRLVAIRVN